MAESVVGSLNTAQFSQKLLEKQPYRETLLHCHRQVGWVV